jgi:hypothetical protein
MPNVPVAGPAGLIGSLLWLVWMVIMGVFLLRSKADVVAAPISQSNMASV